MSRGRREIVQCDYCGNNISVNGWLLDNMKTHFCNKECADNYKREMGVRGKRHPRYNRIKINCSNCEKELYRTPSQLKGRKHFYCNRKCCDEHRATGIYRGERNKNWKGGLIEVECATCGIDMKIKPYRLKNKTGNVFCSQSCLGQWLSKTKKGKDSYNWKGGINLLSNTIRASIEGRAWMLDIFERDGYICKKCNCGSNKLHAHHIKGLTEILREESITTIKDALENSMIMNIDNGVTLCNECHWEFHSLYTNDKFTPENYYEWINNIKIAV